MITEKQSHVMWSACEDCGTERWVRLSDTRKSNYTGLCHSCVLRKRNGKLKDSPNWKGGIKHCDGAVFVYIGFLHKFSSMADSLGYVKRSRLVMAQYLNRLLTSNEEVHHKDGNRNNDDISNMILFPSRSEHQRYHRVSEINVLGLRPVNKIGQYIKGGYKCHQ